MDEVLISWKKQYTVNNTELDNQHKKLFDLINRMFKAFQEGKANEVLFEAIEETIEYSKYHFEFEERLLKEYNYPAIEDQINDHKFYTEKVEKFFSDYSNTDKQIAYDFMIFLKKWLMEHILNKDQEYKIYIK